VRIAGARVLNSARRWGGGEHKPEEDVINEGGLADWDGSQIRLKPDPT
jgi:hypothetical protein